jgi:phosphonate transport system permease protein
MAIAAAALVSAAVLDLDLAKLVAGLGRMDTARTFFGAALHPTLSAEGPSGASLWPLLWEGVRTTIVFALGATGLSIVVGIPLGLLASHRLWSGPGWVAIRVLIALMRSVHELLWAIVLLAALGLSPVTAVIAIAIPYTGTLAKVFAELIDEAPIDAAKALRTHGATRIQALILGIVPRAAPDMLAYTFYRFECAIRASAVLGFFGFPTLGYCILKSSENLYFREVWAFLYALIALMVIAEWWSGALRRRLVIA